jgi:hypothetical protein
LLNPNEVTYKARQRGGVLGAGQRVGLNSSTRRSELVSEVGHKALVNRGAVAGMWSV